MLDSNSTTVRLECQPHAARLLRSTHRATGLSKSGLNAHFGSKEELHLATIEAARLTFVDNVIRPGLSALRGTRRLLATCDAFPSHVERKVYPGGCFFAAAAEVGSRRDAVHDAIAAQQRRWLELLEQQAREAQELGELSADIDAAQLALEIEALLVAANITFILFEDSTAFERARSAIRQRLGCATSERQADTATGFRGRKVAVYDAIVVGARCAGAALAMVLARRGHRVALVDRGSPPRALGCPKPSTYRPPDSWWSVAAVIARVAGVRPHTESTPDTTWI